MISDKPDVLAWDVLSAGSAGEIGNLPETILGSYKLTYVVNSIDEHGRAEITFTVMNPMTRDSFTRIPGSGGQHAPWYDTLNDANKKDGTWADTQQTFVWTELVQAPK